MKSRQSRRRWEVNSDKVGGDFRRLPAYNENPVCYIVKNVGLVTWHLKETHVDQWFHYKLAKTTDSTLSECTSHCCLLCLDFNSWKWLKKNSPGHHLLWSAQRAISKIIDTPGKCHVMFAMTALLISCHIILWEHQGLKFSVQQLHVWGGIKKHQMSKPIRKLIVVTL